MLTNELIPYLKGLSKEERWSLCEKLAHCSTPHFFKYMIEDLLTERPIAVYSGCQCGLVDLIEDYVKEQKMSTPEIDLMRYERENDYWSAYDKAHEEESQELMSAGNECDPYDGDNFCEAMNEMCIEHRMEIEEILKQPHPDMAKLGELVYDLNFDYWCAKADDRASEILERRCND